MIDTKINSVDRAWPIMNPDLKIEVSSQQQQTSGQQQQGGGGGGHVVHVNPKFLNGKQPTSVKQENKQQEKIQEKKKIQPDINANKLPQQPSQQQSSQHKGGGPPTKRPRTTTTAQHSSSNVSNKSTQRSVKPQQPRVSKQNVLEPSRTLGTHAFNIVMNSQPTHLLQPQIVPPPQLQQHQQQFPPPQIPTSSITDQPQLVMIPQVSSAPLTNFQQLPRFIKEIPPPQITTMKGNPQQRSFSPPPIQSKYKLISLILKSNKICRHK
ncbi:unnamed protein product [Meloidogyne enterolobii]|uniref:Uncharacterized protein n=1 Tax=Meloidogyne enterolobii TaxID=390850 RepID=A0ACB0YS38_MELEN